MSTDLSTIAALVSLLVSCVALVFALLARREASVRYLESNFVAQSLQLQTDVDELRALCERIVANNRKRRSREAMREKREREKETANTLPDREPNPPATTATDAERAEWKRAMRLKLHLGK